MSLRGLLAFVPQVKWPDNEKKPTEKLILVQRDTLIQASCRKEPGFAFTPPMQRKDETKIKSNASLI